MRKRTLLVIGGIAALGLVVVGTSVQLYRRWGLSDQRNAILAEFFRAPQAHVDWMVSARQRCTVQAPFILPTSGLIGYLWDDSFQIGKRHQGLDIFGGTGAGETPVYAAYSGFLTRLPGWKSSLVIRIPADPLEPTRQIWTYYTHLADPSGTHSFIVADFPAGSSEIPVEAGQLLGYQGNYSGDPRHPTGVHLHFSIVQDDGRGKFRNELDIRNTLDPSPYLGLALNGRQNRNQILTCPEPGSSHTDLSLRFPSNGG